jgi:hypothetical protein
MEYRRISLAIDQYAEAATGNREFFLNKPRVVTWRDWKPIRKIGEWWIGRRSLEAGFIRSLRRRWISVKSKSK